MQRLSLLPLLLFPGLLCLLGVSSVLLARGLVSLTLKFNPDVGCLLMLHLEYLLGDLKKHKETWYAYKSLLRKREILLSSYEYNIKELLRLLWRALDQIVIPLGLPQGAKLFFKVHPCMERSSIEKRKLG